MNRNIQWGLRVAINLIRCPFNSLLHGFHTKFKGIQKISLMAHMEAGSDGKLIVDSSTTIDGGTVCRASQGRMLIGSHVYVNRNCNIVCHENIMIGDHCTIGPNVCIYDHDHDFRSHDRATKYITKPIVIGSNVWIGANAIILKGVTIGDNAVIAAGAIVKENVPADCIYYVNMQSVTKKIGN